MRMAREHWNDATTIPGINIGCCCCSTVHCSFSSSLPSARASHSRIEIHKDTSITMSSNAEHASVVTLTDRNMSESSPWTNKASVISLLHPSTGENQHFIVSNKDIYEMQSVSRKYGSFFVGSRVISNGALHVMTRVDPLFFVLASLDATKEGRAQWQPLDQLQVPQVLQDALPDPKQWKHVCAVKNLDHDDLVLYKFQECKALAWLVKKQHAAFQVVSQQMLESKRNIRQVTDKLMSEGGGAFSNTFHLIADDDEAENGMDTTNNAASSSTLSTELTSLERTVAKEASVQIICEYLSPDWQIKLRKHLHMEIVEAAVENDESESKKRHASWEANPGQNDADQLLQLTMGTGSTNEDAALSKKEPAKSAGLKRLAKVNTKGMKSLSNFFGAKKKKTSNEKV